MLVVMGAQAEVTKITPILSAVKESKGQVVEMPAARRVAPSVREMESPATLQRLDSVVGFNSDGGKGSLQRFVYNDKGWWTETHYYYWNADTQSWGAPVQSILVDRMDNGYVLSESNIFEGFGVRADYVYDERNRGIEKIDYSMNPEDGEWIPTGKGEYAYDDNDNIIEEYVYAFNQNLEDWVNVNHNYATWDAKGRQTSIDSFYWDGNEWVRSMKLEYRWYDGPYDPDYIPGAEKERMTYRLEYMEIDGNTSVDGVEAEYGICYRDNTVYGDGRETIAVTIYDLAGQNVMAAEGTEVSLRTLAKGVYVVEAEAASGVTRAMKVCVK